MVTCSLLVAVKPLGLHVHEKKNLTDETTAICASCAWTCSRCFSTFRSTDRNCAFEQDAHTLLLSSGNVNFLPYILLPLCGPEEFDLEEMDKFPEELQLLPPDKERESDASIRLILVETLVLLCRTREGRDLLRSKGVYEIVKVAHKVERDEEVRIAIERLVNLLMRDEVEEPKIAEINTDATAKGDEDEDEDMVVQEV